MEVTVFYNPACSNCRTTEGILNEKGVDANYVRYLETRPSRAEIEQVMKLLGTDDPHDLVRTNEPLYNVYDLGKADSDTVLDAMARHPVLIQRPIVIRGERAVIARPPERVLELLEDGVDAQPAGTGEQ
jgi:arsenate reductase (glutaredoxin)